MCSDYGSNSNVVLLHRPQQDKHKVLFVLSKPPPGDAHLCTSQKSVCFHSGPWSCHSLHFSTPSTLSVSKANDYHLCTHVADVAAAAALRNGIVSRVLTEHLALRRLSIADGTLATLTHVRTL